VWAQTGPTPPATPVGTLDDDGRVTIAWTANPEPDIGHYEVWRIEQVGKAFVPEFLDLSARCGKDYIYLIKAVDEVTNVSGWSPMSAVVQVRITGLPSSLKATEDEETGSVTLSVE